MVSLTANKERTAKRDPTDSRKLARNLRSAEVKGIYVPTRSRLEDRSLFESFLSLVRQHTRCKNQITSFLFFYGLNLPEEIVTQWDVFQGLISLEQIPDESEQRRIVQ